MPLMAFPVYRVIPALKETRAVTEFPELPASTDAMVAKVTPEFASLAARESKETKEIVDWTDWSVLPAKEDRQASADIPDNLATTVFSAHLVYLVLR